MSMSMIHRIIVGMAIMASVVACTPAHAGVFGDVADAYHATSVSKVYAERNVDTDVSEFGVVVNLPADYFLEAKRDTTGYVAGTLGKSVQLSDSFTFVPSVKYGVLNINKEANTDHETYFEGILEYMPVAAVYVYGGAGYSFMNEGQDYSKLKAGASYDIHPEMTVGYNYTRQMQNARDDFDLGLPTSNEHEVVMTMVGHTIEPYVKLRHTVTTGIGYDNSAIAGLALVF